MSFHLIVPTLKFLGENVESNHGLVNVVNTNDATKKYLPRILGRIGYEDLQQKVSQCFLKQSTG